MRKQPVQLPVEIFPVPVPQGQSHAETDDAVYLCFQAHVQNAGNIVLGIIDKGQDGREPHHGGNP